MASPYYRGIVFIAACLSIFLFGVILISLGTIIPFLSSGFGLDTLSKGTLATVFPFGILAGSLLFGPVADRYGYRYLLTASVLIVTGCYLLIAQADSYFLVVFVFFFLGLGGGILNGTANAMVSGLSEDAKENKSANLSLMGVFFGIGALGMPLLFGWLTRYFRFEELMTGIGMILTIPMTFFLLIRYPSGGSSANITFSKWLRLVGSPLMLMIGMIGFFQSGLESLVNNWLTSYLIGILGQKQETALFALTLFVIVFTLARLMLGLLLRKYSSGLILTISMALVIFGIIILMALKPSGMYMISLVCFGLGLASIFPVITGFAGDLFREQPGTAISVLFTLSLLGNMAINYLTGWVTFRAGMDSYPVIFLCIVIFTSLFILLFYRKKRNRINS